MVTMKDIGLRLKEIREGKNLNQRDFAKKIGISQSMLSGIENGIGKCTKRTQKSVCFEFGIEETWLQTGEGPMFAPQKPSPEAVLGLDGRELAPDERQLLETYGKLIPECRQEVSDYAAEKLELQELREKASTNTHTESGQEADFNEKSA